ncbi:MAG: histidinol-phosphate transaminase [Deltaproteobacteria bacterium]|nr:histidinol-phosphate transaminase [Deltaproteobacteria bacterium]
MKILEALVPYPPGKPMEELERELGIKNSIKLASNENPLGPSPKAVEAVAKALKNLHRYPDGGCYYLKEKLAQRLKVKPENLIIGNGSNEIIELVIRTFLRPGDEAVMGNPSFAVYPLVVPAAGGKSVLVPLKNLTHDLDAMFDAITENTKLVFIANPNNPTGTMNTKAQLDKFIGRLRNDIILILDEAYYEFVTDKDFPASLDYLNSGKNIVILRTFSKIYGLAGLRVGYGIAPEKLNFYMNKVRQPFNVNSLAQIAAMAALDDDEHLKRSQRNNREGLAYLFGELKAMGLECVPTQANFFLIKVGKGKDVYPHTKNFGVGVYDALLRQGVIVRPMASYGLGEYIRVTVGLPEENKRFVEALKKTVNSRQEKDGRG